MSICQCLVSKLFSFTFHRCTRLYFTVVFTAPCSNNSSGVNGILKVWISSAFEKNSPSGLVNKRNFNIMFWGMDKGGHAVLMKLIMLHTV